MAYDQSNNADLDLKKADLRIKKWDVLIKGMGAVAVLVSIWFTYYQYGNSLRKEKQDRDERAKHDMEQKEREIQSALRESQKPFLERQLDLYLQASGTASKLSTLENGPARDEARKRFWQLYWGELSLVEDKEVEAAMVHFGRALTQFENHEIERSEVQEKSFELARSCRKSLEQSWGYTLAELRGKEK
jgi:hypothetical protein